MAATPDSVSDGAGAESRDIQAGADSSGSQLTIYNNDSADNNNNGAANASDGNINGGDPQVPRAVGGAGSASNSGNNRASNNAGCANRPLILITDPNSGEHFARGTRAGQNSSSGSERLAGGAFDEHDEEEGHFGTDERPVGQQQHVEEQVEEVDGIRYRILAAVTKPALPLARSRSAGPTASGGGGGSVKRRQAAASSSNQEAAIREENEAAELDYQSQPVGSSSQARGALRAGASRGRLASSVRRKSSAFVSNLLHAATFAGPQSRSSQDLGAARRPRRLSIYEMTKSPPPETSLEIYLSERRRSSTISSKQVQQQLEQQSTFETNYCQRQQYFKDLNQKLINHDKKLLNVVANRGQIHRHSVDIAQLPLHLAAKARASKSSAPASVSVSRARTPSGTSSGQTGGSSLLAAAHAQGSDSRSLLRGKNKADSLVASRAGPADQDKSSPLSTINQASAWRAGQRAKPASARSRVGHRRKQKPAAAADDDDEEKISSEVEGDGDRAADLEGEQATKEASGEDFLANDAFGQQDEEPEDAASATGRLGGARSSKRSQAGGKLVAILENKSLLATEAVDTSTTHVEQKRGSVASSRGHKKSRIVIRKFQKLDPSELSSGPAPDVKIGQRVAYKEYYGNEFGTIRWIGRVPQISSDWTVGVEFDNAIGEGDGSLNGRRYFIAKDCFAKFLPLSSVALVDQHVGRPEPGTMISVMSAAVRPGQMISIQRVSTVHVQHCFLNAPHRIPGADILAVNTRLHCQCPNCGPCAHVIKPPRTQRLARSKKNATHMCQFSTYTCCGMESQEEAMCTYTGNKVVSLPPPITSSMAGLPPIGNSWIEGSGYLTQLQEQQSKLMPEEYRFGALPEDSDATVARRRLSRSSSKRSSSRHRHKRQQEANGSEYDDRKQSAETYDHDRDSSAVPPMTVGSEAAQQRQQLQEQQQLLITNSQSPQPPPPNYTSSNIASSNNLHQISNTIPSYSPSLDYSNYNKMAVACPDVKEAKAAYVEPVWCEPSNIGSRVEKGAKVVHRDSIENRYLFPTDEPIDSTLEADLENLSQARYGHNTSTRLNGSRNIFKSLRSLVSCLGVQTDRSELDRHSENTFRYSDHGTKGVNNKSMPAIASPANNQPNRNYQHKNHQYQNYNSNQRHQHQQTDCCARCKNNSSPTMPEKDDKFYAHNSYNAAHGDQTKQALHSDQAMKRHISSSSDCGFSSASQNSINFQSYQACSPSMSIDDERKTYQIYKRIVARLMNTATVSNEDLLRLRRARFENCCLHSINQASFAPALVEPPDQIIADIIQKSYMHQDKGYEQSIHRRATSGCHSKRTATSGAATTVDNGFDTDKLDEYFKSFSFDQQQQQPKNNIKRMIKRSDSAQTSSITQREHSQHCSRKSTTNQYQSNKPRSLIDGSFTSESVTLSSHDSICGTVPVGSSDFRSNASTVDLRRKEKTKVDDAKSVDSANLPKAFELKLTLSINSDKNTQILEDPHEIAKSVVKSSSVNDEFKGSASNLMNSTFNINIVSKGKEDHSNDSNHSYHNNHNSDENGEKNSRSAGANCLDDSHEQTNHHNHCSDNNSNNSSET